MLYMLYTCRVYTYHIYIYIYIYIYILDQLLEFKQRIGEVHPSIKFDWKLSYKEINFLGTAVYKTTTGKLETKL